MFLVLLSRPLSEACDRFVFSLRWTCCFGKRYIGLSAVRGVPSFLALAYTWLLMNGEWLRRLC